MNSTKKLIKIAQHAGFCYGVKRAVDLTINIKESNIDKNVNVLGQLIHNNQVIEHLESLGINTIEQLSDDLSGICIIRTHGTTPKTFEQLKNIGCEIVDATCPDVKRVQEKARLLSQEGYQVIIIGKPDHPEVIAIKAYAELDNENEALVISSPQEAEELIPEIKKAKKIGVVIQTTQKKDIFTSVLQIIAEHAKEMKLYNTICNATEKRQQEALELAQSVDLMIVAGSKSSANTTHLAEIVKNITTTIHIETKEELNKYKELIEKAQSIGITAGASTPQNIINEIISEVKKGE